MLEQHADLRGYLCCDASGPIGIATALKRAGRVGAVTVVGMDSIRPILEAIKEGVIDSSSATIPVMQGSMSVLMLWQASIGVRIPQAIDTGIEVITQAIDTGIEVITQAIDTGIEVITQENVDRYLAAAE